MAEGLITVKSNFEPDVTKARLLDVLKQKGITVFADIDHAAGASLAGQSLAPTDVVVFGNPKAGTPFMQKSQTAGIDLPLKALIWKDASGITYFSYNDPHWIAARHGIVEGNVADALSAVLATLASHSTGA